MSFCPFDDFDASPLGLLDDDFPTDYSIVVSSKGPHGSVVETNTALEKPNCALSPSLSISWNDDHSGFNLDKLEINKDAQLNIEASIAGVFPGVNIAYSGNSENESEISMTYESEKATITSSIDVHGFNKYSVSINTGRTKDITFGGTIEVTAEEDSKAYETSLNIGAGYTISELLFAGIRANDNFKGFSATAEYKAFKNTSVAGKLDYSAEEVSLAAVTSYNYDDETNLKLKASSDGIVAACVKRELDKNCSVVAAISIPSSLKGITFGLSGTIG